MHNSVLRIISSDEYDHSNLLVRTCEESIAVNKCEGACASSIQPSALKHTGFQKVRHINLQYRVSHLVAYSGWVDSGLE